MEKINIVELLKDCPKGMELDCAMYDNLYFESLNSDYYGTINCYTLIDGIKTSINFTKYGTFNNHTEAKCVIYPKGKTTWEGFHRPFKEGDIIRVRDEYSDATFIYVAILKQIEKGGQIYSHCSYNYESAEFSTDDYLFDVCSIRFATEEEKDKLYKVIKDNGYKWNPETKVLEKLIQSKFKVGDRIILKDNPHNIPSIKIKAVTKSQYILENEGFLYIDSTDEKYVLEDRFDITTLKPFDKVLVRGDVGQKWTHDFFGFMDKDKGYPFVCVGHYVIQCIPYEGNEHLLGKTDDCDEYFKV